MSHITGLVPDSQNGSGSPNLKQFNLPFQAGYTEKDNQDYPLNRSGHRCFTDNDYFYVIGGYTTEIQNGAIFKEVWAMSLATFEWRRYETKGVLPDSLASFALIQTYPYSKSVILFGGSGTTFGSTSSDEFYMLSINNDDCSIESQKLRVEGTLPQAVYGHAMCSGEVPGKYYIIGGTTGHIFNFDVYSLTIKENPTKEDGKEDYTFECELITRNTTFSGRYRLEATYDETKNSLVFFGGGNQLEVFGFESMVVLNLGSKDSTEMRTVPDAKYGYPAKRRCHTIARRGRKVIMTGGVDHTLPEDQPPVLGDVWIFDLNDFSWKKYEHPLHKPVYFHDSVMTIDGWMLCFGGAHELNGGSRSNTLSGAWFGVPSLQQFAIESIRKAYPHMFSGLYCGNLRFSEIIDIVNVFYKRETIQTKERAIIEHGRMKFHEKKILGTAIQGRYFLNSHFEESIVTHEANNEPLRRRRRGDRLPEPVDEVPNIMDGFQEVHQRMRRFLNRLMNVVNIENEEERVNEGEVVIGNLENEVAGIMELFVEPDNQDNAEGMNEEFLPPARPNRRRRRSPD